MNRYIDAVKSKHRGLTALIRLRGKQLNDLWRQKKPDKEMARVEKTIRIKSSFLDNPPPEFPNLRHKSGCSLQFILMCNMIMGGNIYKEYCNQFQEGIVENSEFDIAELLVKARKVIQNERS